MSYYLIDGTEVTREQIESAFAAGNARLVIGYNRAYNPADPKSLAHTTSLRIDGHDYDTRGTEPMMSCQAWTTRPESLTEALAAAG